MFAGFHLPSYLWSNLNGHASLKCKPAGKVQARLHSLSCWVLVLSGASYVVILERWGNTFCGSFDGQRIRLLSE